MEIVPLGTTALPQDVIHEYLAVLKRIYTPEVSSQHDILDHLSSDY